MIYLASASPRRAQLLAQIGLNFTPLLHAAHEDAEQLEAERSGESPEHYVERVCHAKLDAALERWSSRRLPVAPILCADTTVALGPTILGKPHDRDHARHMLQRLQGQTHQVWTCVAVARPTLANHPPWRASRKVRSLVSFASLSKADIEWLTADHEPDGKAGAYAIQGRAAAFIHHIEGSFSGIMGLPLYETAVLLQLVRKEFPQPS